LLLLCVSVAIKCSSQA